MKCFRSKGLSSKNNTSSYILIVFGLVLKKGF